MIEKITSIVLLISNIEFFIDNTKDIILFILNIFFNINRYIINDHSKIHIIKNNILDNTTFINFSKDNSNKPVDFVFGYDKYIFLRYIYIPYPIYICYIYNHTFGESNLSLISTSYIKNILSKNNKILINSKENIVNINNNISLYEIENTNKKEIEVLMRNGIFSNIDYTKITIDMSKSKENLIQKKIIDNIVEHYNNKSRGIFYIYGNTGVGKTFISYLLSYRINGILCDTFVPTDPGDIFRNLYSKMNPTKYNPLIILLDEIDIIIKNIHNSKISHHKYYSKEVFDKTSWNKFLDRFDYGHYPNTIILLTSNLEPEKINEYDKSYIRKGRITEYFYIKDKIH
jgi:hypothetical protein